MDIDAGGGDTLQDPVDECCDDRSPAPDAEAHNAYEKAATRRAGTPAANEVAVADKLVDHSLILFPAARYVEAIDDVARGFGYLVAHGQEAGVDLSLPLWVTRLGTPWAQMSAGRLGDALAGFATNTGSD